MNGEFQFDDDRLIRFNFALRNLSDWQSILRFEPYRPIGVASFAVNYSIGQKNPFPYHLTNITLHSIVTILFFFLLRRNSREILFCLIAAVLFAVHPLNTESVTYVSGRFILLCAVFYMAAILVLDTYLRKQKITALFSFLLLSVLSIFSKEEGALIPISALLYNYAFFGRASVKQHRLLHGITVLVVAAGGMYRLQLEHQSGNIPHPLLTYFATEMFVWLRYIWLAIFPMRLNVDHDIQPLSLAAPQFWIASAVIIAIAAGLWRIRKSQPVLFFWGFWFFVNLLASSLIPLNDFMAEHRTYLSLMGFCAVAGSLGILFRNPGVEYSRLIAISICLMIVLFSTATVIRNRIWQTKLTLWYDAVQKSPEKFRTHLNLAYSLYERGAYLDAIAEYSIARNLQPNVPRIDTGLGFCYLSTGNLREAERNLNRALSLDPQYIDAKTGLGILRYKERKFAEALSYFEQAFPYRRESIDLIAMMSVCYIKMDQPERAISLLQTAPSSQKLSNALDLMRRGKQPEAIQMLNTSTN